MLSPRRCGPLICRRDDIGTVEVLRLRLQGFALLLHLVNHTNVALPSANVITITWSGDSRTSFPPPPLLKLELPDGVAVPDETNKKSCLRKRKSLIRPRSKTPLLRAARRRRLQPLKSSSPLLRQPRRNLFRRPHLLWLATSRPRPPRNLPFLLLPSPLLLLLRNRPRLHRRSPLLPSRSPGIPRWSAR